jgi:hypothetical protein
MLLITYVSVFSISLYLNPKCFIDKLTYHTLSSELTFHHSSKNFIIIIFLRGLGRLTCSDIDALSSFPRAYTISFIIWSADIHGCFFASEYFISRKNVINKIVCTLSTKLEVCEFPSLQEREDFEGKERISSHFWNLYFQLFHRQYFNQVLVHHVAEGT